MGKRIAVKRDKTLQERLFAEAQRLIQDAAKTPSEAYRDLLLRRVSKLEEALRVQKWLASPELQAPK
jgi:hypothetical protein